MINAMQYTVNDSYPHSSAERHKAKIARVLTTARSIHQSSHPMFLIIRVRTYMRTDIETHAKVKKVTATATWTWPRLVLCAFV